MGTMASVGSTERAGNGHFTSFIAGPQPGTALRTGLDQIFDIRANGASPPECGALEPNPRGPSPVDKKKEQTRRCWRRIRHLRAAPEIFFALRRSQFLKTRPSSRDAFEVSWPLHDVADSSSRTACWSVADGSLPLGFSYGEFEAWSGLMRKFKSRRRSFSIFCTVSAKPFERRFARRSCTG